MNINKNKQKGVVLLIALIVLVAMSLAGIALNRSVDTAMGISGNLAFKQSTTNGADKGIATAIQWLNANSGSTTLDNDSSGNGYYSNAPVMEPDWKSETTWTSAAANGTDGAGNNIQYMIHRLCSFANTPYNGVTGSGQQNQCSMMEAATFGAAGNSISAGAFQFTGTPQVIFRITSRSVGPKSSKSVVQTFYSIPM